MQKFFNTGLKEYLNPYFKSKGFKHEGSYYIKSFDEYALLFNLQKSQYNTASKVKCTFNIGINIFDYFDLLHRDNDTPRRGTFSWLRRRIGHLLSDDNDKWYTISEESDLAESFTGIIGDINCIFETYPFDGTLEKLLLSIKGTFRNDDNITEYLSAYYRKKQLLDSRGESGKTAI
jgi:hypothetical protein